MKQKDLSLLFQKKGNYKMFDKVKEECGVFGIYSKAQKEDLIGQVCVGLSALQHRGEESCGVAINEDGIIHFHKAICHKGKWQ